LGGEADGLLAYESMARKPREEVAGGIHHVYARGNNRRLIFLNAADRYRYLKLLAGTTARKRWRCLAYCLMDNHVHLLIETPEPNLGAGMQLLHGNYGRAHNDRHGSSGHVFQGRYGSVLVTSDEQLWTTVGYIARNPVEAKLCERPEEWPWSSHAATLGGRAPRWLDVRRLLGYLSGAGGDPLERYAELTEPLG
jgi:putative transposase